MIFGACSKGHKQIIPCTCFFIVCLFAVHEIRINTMWNANFAKFLNEVKGIKTPFMGIQRNQLNVVEQDNGFTMRCNSTSEKCQWPLYLPPSKTEFLRSLQLENFTKEERQFLEQRIAIYVQRAETVADFCLSHPEQLKAKDRIYIWDYEKRTPPVVYCFIQKVASTTWISNFLLLADFNLNDPEIQKLPLRNQKFARFDPMRGWTHETALKIYKPPPSLEEKIDVFKNSIRFLVVRHPFSRIVSAYRVKMLMRHPNLSDDWKYAMIRQEAISKYRPKNSSNTSEFPTFAEYVDYLIENHAELRRKEHWDHFPLNVFQLQSESCNVCGSDFNLIMKLETIDEDEAFLSLIADMQQVKEKVELPKYIHRLQNNKDSYTLSPDFYKTIKKKQMLKLYEVYKDDFELFDYTINEYLEFAKS